MEAIRRDRPMSAMLRWNRLDLDAGVGVGKADVYLHQCA